MSLHCYKYCGASPLLWWHKRRDSNPQGIGETPVKSSRALICPSHRHGHNIRCQKCRAEPLRDQNRNRLGLAICGAVELGKMNAQQGIKGLFVFVVVQYQKDRIAPHFAAADVVKVAIQAHLSFSNFYFLKMVLG